MKHIIKSIPRWYYNENSHSGVNYSNQEIVKDYDNQHAKFRDFETEANKISQALNIGKNDTIVDLGCGSGELSIQLSSRCKKIYAVDISTNMIDLCNKKISEKKLENITPICSGLLSYQHDSEPADIVISNVVLHHLPDFWKMIALKKINDLLKPGGKFFLFDIVYSFPVENHKENITNWLNGMKEKAGEKMMEESIIHVRDEFSTWDWIIEKMLELSGFKIVHIAGEMPNTKAYICIKE